MLRLTAFFLAFHVATSADSTQEHVRNFMGALSESLDEAAPAGSARRLAIDAILKGVQEAEKVTPLGKEKVQNASNMIDQILLGRKTIRDLLQGKYDNMTQDTSACNTTHVFDWNESGLSTLDQAHATCRSQNEARWAAVFTTCLQVRAKLQGTKPADYDRCRPYPPQKSDWESFGAPNGGLMQEWKTYFSDHSSAASIYNADLIRLNDACTEAKRAWTANNSDCNTKQLTYEQAVCNEKSRMVGLCQQHDACTQAQKNIWGQLSGDRTDAYNNAALCAALLKVKCLLNKFRNDDLDSALWGECNATPAQIAPYNVTFPSQPTLLTTNCSDIYSSLYSQAFPGDNTWGYNFNTNGTNGTWDGSIAAQTTCII